MRGLLIFFVVLCLAVGITYAQTKTPEPSAPGDVHTITLPVMPIELKPGAGLDKTSTLCNICHSTDYITMQPNFSQAQWTATVDKMIKMFGAPINEDDSKMIINYLVTHYGTGE